MILGLLLALASALATNVAFLFKERGAVLVAPIRVRHPLHSAAALFRSRWFVVGWLIAILAWVLHAGALSRAPLSIVQAVLSGGLGFLAVLAERFFGFHLGRWQWFGVMITAARLAVVGFTGGGASRPQRSSLAVLVAVESAISAVAAVLVAISFHRRVMHRAEGLLLGLAAGALDLTRGAAEARYWRQPIGWPLRSAAASPYACPASGLARGGTLRHRRRDRVGQPRLRCPLSAPAREAAPGWSASSRGASPVEGQPLAVITLPASR